MLCRSTGVGQRREHLLRMHVLLSALVARAGAELHRLGQLRLQLHVRGMRPQPAPRTPDPTPWSRPGRCRSGRSLGEPAGSPASALRSRWAARGSDDLELAPRGVALGFREVVTRGHRQLRTKTPGQIDACRPQVFLQIGEGDVGETRLPIVEAVDEVAAERTRGHIGARIADAQFVRRIASRSRIGSAQADRDRIQVDVSRQLRAEQLRARTSPCSVPGSPRPASGCSAGPRRDSCA